MCTFKLRKDVNGDELSQLKDKLNAATRQMMLQQFFTEERVRSEGQSGVKQIRSRSHYNENYKSPTHTGRSAIAIHDHSNNIRTVGMGEFIGVLNGIEFRTRHNDYRLYMPHRTSKEYHETEEVPFPDVPPQVTNQPSVDDEIKEMRQWFLAFKNQNASHRDYKKYFKPVLTYLEGTWTTTTEKLDEPFDSDRHFLDAKNWFDLQDRVRFTSYTGGKSRLENLAFLPTTITGMTNTSVPIFAQFNYRIVCHPISVDIPLSHFELVDEINTRMNLKMTLDKYRQSRAARFNLKPEFPGEKKVNKRFTFLDKIMGEIPGKDNYAGKLYDEGLDGNDPAYNVETPTLTKKDVSRYHRFFKVGGKDAMGLDTFHRGFSDPFLFAAMTTQDKVAGFEVENKKKCKGPKKNRVCEKIRQKWSYAIPLEVIYLTPLSKWNPYNLWYKGNLKTPLGKTVTVGGRSGACSDKSKSFNGTNSKIFYQTPTEFYEGGEISTDPADTTRGSVCVLDQTGEKRKVKASGTRIFLPNIRDVGVIRQRYPIFPVHGEGGSVWKVVNALFDYIMDPAAYSFIQPKSSVSGGGSGSGGGSPGSGGSGSGGSGSGSGGTSGGSLGPQELKTGNSRNPKATTAHDHQVDLTKDEVATLQTGKWVNKTTTHANGHAHELTIRYNKNKKIYQYVICDNQGRNAKGYYPQCWDKHPKNLITINTDSEANN